jgi:hypothetical protein
MLLNAILEELLHTRQMLPLGVGVKMRFCQPLHHVGANFFRRSDKSIWRQQNFDYQTAQQRIARRELEAMKIAAEIEREIQEQEAEIAKVFGINGTPRA